jgi:hypothetical protein
MDEQRSVAALGERRELVSSEGAERRSGDLDQPEAGTARPDGSEHHRVRLPIELDRRDLVVVVAPVEEHVADAEAVRPGALPGPLVGWHDGRLERQLDTGDAETLHLRVRLEEARAEEVQPPLERRAAVLERLPVDEVLHRVGGDDVAVVAFGVRSQERLTEHLHVDLGCQHDVRTARERRLGNRPKPRQRRRVGAVGRNLGLAVVDVDLVPVALRALARHARFLQRSRAMSTTALSPVSSSSSRGRSRRRSSSGTIADRGRPATKMTKRKPKRLS